MSISDRAEVLSLTKLLCSLWMNTMAYYKAIRYERRFSRNVKYQLELLTLFAALVLLFAGWVVVRAQAHASTADGTGAEQRQSGGQRDHAGTPH